MLVRICALPLLITISFSGCTYTDAPTFSVAGRYANNCKNPRETIILHRDGTASAKYKQQIKILSWQQKNKEIIFSDINRNQIVSQIDKNGNLTLHAHPKLKGKDKYVPIKELVRYRCH